jgi:HAMP domain-containing protein
MIILYAIAILPVLFVYIYYVSRSVLLGWVSLLVVLLYDYSLGATVYSPGGVNLSIVDIVEMSLLVAGIIRTIQQFRKRDTGRTIAFLYLGIFAFSLARGTMAHGFVHAAAGSRLFVGMLTACTYFLSAPADPKSVRKYLLAYIYYGVALAFVAFLANAGLRVGMIASLAKQGDELEVMRTLEQGSRLLAANCALTLTFCFFLTLAYSRYRSNGDLFKWLSALFLGLTVFLRHRSVWAVLVAGIVCLLLVDRSLIRRLIPLAVLAMCIAAGYALLSGTSSQKVEAEFSESATNDNTWIWRVANWGEQLARNQTAFSALFGLDLGGGYEVFDMVTGRYTEVPPHNEYILEYLSVGISGVAVVLCFTIRPLRRFWKLCSTDMKAVEPSASAWVAVILGVIVFNVPYVPAADTYALLGIANAIVTRLDKDPAALTAKDAAALPAVIE